MTTTTEELSPTLSFDAMGLSAPIRAAIDEIGWEIPTECQVESFGPACAGKDLIVQSRTGTGKTAAFGLPLVDTLVSEKPGVQALILAPTRELALQSAREIGRLASKRNLTTTAIYGGAPMEKQIRALDAGTQIVSGTPGRVLDHLKRGTLDPSGLKVLVLDEADEMLSMGFAKELHAIMEMLPKPRQTLLFSATVDGPIKRVGERHMTDPVLIELSGDAVGALGVTHYIYMVSGAGRARDLTKIIESEDPESAIIFCNTKAETEQVAAYLQQAGYGANWLNGDLAQNERERVMGRAREGKLRFLVATDVAARGIDISHVTHVINFALPPHLEQYIHRTGRTGRAGRTGTAISLVAPQELGTLYYLRLQYGIFPIERSLPSQGEEQTRREMDRVEMLAAAFGSASEIDQAVARRLLTHVDAEQILSGLVGAFFGTQEGVDDAASAARREKAPTPMKTESADPAKTARKTKKKNTRKKKAKVVVSGETEETSSPESNRAPKREARQAREPRREAKSREPKRETPREPEQETKSREPKQETKSREPKQETKSREPKRERTHKKRVDSRPPVKEELKVEANVEAEQTPAENDGPDAPKRSREEAKRARKEAREARRLARKAESTETVASAPTAPEAEATPEAIPEATVEPKSVQSPVAASAETSETAETADAVIETTLVDGDAEAPTREPRRDEEEGFTRLYVNMGKKDRMRVGDLNEMFQEDAYLSRDEVGRIRLREKHSFVSVPTEKVEAVIAALADVEVDGRLVKVEVARG